VFKIRERDGLRAALYEWPVTHLEQGARGATRLVGVPAGGSFR